MKRTRTVAPLAATLITIGSLAGGANAALILSIDEYSTDALTITISGSFSADTIGDSEGYLAIKNDWENNQGVHTEMFSAMPTISLNTITIGGIAASTDVQNGGSTWQDCIFFTNPLGSENPIFAGTVVSGSIRLTGVGLFDPSDASTLNLVSGFVRPAGADDWARLEAAIVPEPTSALLLGIGVMGATGLRRRIK